MGVVVVVVVTVLLLLDGGVFGDVREPHPSRNPASGCKRSLMKDFAIGSIDRGYDISPARMRATVWSLARPGGPDLGVQKGE